MIWTVNLKYVGNTDKRDIQERIHPQYFTIVLNNIGTKCGAATPNVMEAIKNNFIENNLATLITGLFQDDDTQSSLTIIQNNVDAKFGVDRSNDMEGN